VSTISIDAGQTIVDTGTTELVDDPDNPGTKIKRPVLNISPDGAHDTITVNGLPGEDQFTISGNNAEQGIQIVHAEGQTVVVRDTFIDASAACTTASSSCDNDTLIETFDLDMSLYQDTFVVGYITADNDPGTSFAAAAGDNLREDQLEAKMDEDNPNVRRGLG